MIKPGVLFKYKDFLPITPGTPLFSLGEGDTPLVRCRELEKEIGCGELYFKLEGCNPTGSFKDRGMTMAVTKAVEEGSKAIICASTGNTSASAAAYAARAGLTAFVLIPDGKIAQGKLAQAMMEGAGVIQVNGNLDDSMRLVKEGAKEEQVTKVNANNPDSLQGQKTTAFSIVE